MKQDIQLTDEQLKVIQWFRNGNGNLTVEAKAGSSKTTTIILGLNSAKASNAAYFVFNKHNADEAQQKITNPNINVRTFHSEGFSILRKAWGKISASGYREFERIQEIYPDAPPQFVFQAAKLVSFIKNTFINPTLADIKKVVSEKDFDLIKPVIAAGWTDDKMAETALQSIEKSKQKNSKISFEDMIFLPVSLGLVKPAYDLINLDEAQDGNFVQFEMIRRLCLPNGRICIVGDRAQNIYGFRGAMYNSMEHFTKELNCQTLTLSTSFRCPRSVILEAQKYVPEIKAWTNANEGIVKTEKVDDIHKSIKPKDVILSRTNACLVKVCLDLLKKRIPAYVMGRDMIKVLMDIINELNATDINSFNNNLDAWFNIRSGQGTNQKKIAQAKDYYDTLKAISESCLTVDDVKNNINKLFFDSEYVRIPSVICSTIHRYKGKESDNCYVLQYSFTVKATTPEDIQNEINCKYISVTRSKKSLTYVTE